MSNSILHLTPMEERILQVFYQYHIQYSCASSFPLSGSDIVMDGNQLFDPGWAGTRLYNKIGFGRHPMLDRFLGRLHNKGLLTRSSTAELHTDRSRWNLTPLGCELGGLTATDNNQ